MNTMYCNTTVQLPVVCIAPWKTREQKWHAEYVGQQARPENNEPTLFLSGYSTEDKQQLYWVCSLHSRVLTVAVYVWQFTFMQH